MQEEYSSYNPYTGWPRKTVDGETIGKGPTMKVTKKLQSFNKKHDNFRKGATWGYLQKMASL